MDESTFNECLKGFSEYFVRSNVWIRISPREFKLFRDRRQFRHYGRLEGPLGDVQVRPYGLRPIDEKGVSGLESGLDRRSRPEADWAWPSSADLSQGQCDEGCIGLSRRITRRLFRGFVRAESQGCSWRISRVDADQRWVDRHQTTRSPRSEEQSEHGLPGPPQLQRR